IKKCSGALASADAIMSRFGLRGRKAAMNMALRTSDVNDPSYHISGRGLRRRKLSRTERVRLAADLASGQLHLHPSLAQVSQLVGMAAAKVREELKARAAAREIDKHLPVTAFIEAWDRPSEPEREGPVRSLRVADERGA